MTLADKIKKIFGKAQEEALLVATQDAAAEETPPKKAGDEEAQSYDALMKKVDDLLGKVGGLLENQKAGDEAGKADDEQSVGSAKPNAEVKAGDDEESGIEGRLKRLEALVQKLMSTSDDGEEAEDEAEGDLVGDDEEEEGEMTGDTASRIEILAPGLKATGKDAKAKALKAAWATSDGKTVIESLSGGKTPNFKDEKFVDVMFQAVSEILKSQRTKEFAKTRTSDFRALLEPKGAMTADKLNEINEQFYGRKN